MKIHRRMACAIVLLCVPILTARAAPRLRIIPPDRSTFAVGQRFDLRVEATGVTGETATLGVSLNGTPVDQLTETPPEWSSSTGKRSVTIRNLSFDTALSGRIDAVLNDDTGKIESGATFRVEEINGPSPRATSVILMIGDGMGLAHRMSARVVSRGIRDGRYNARLEMDDMEAHGLVSTSSLNALVTDSANGATAYAGGNKTDNGAICVWPDYTTSAADNPRFENIASMIRRTFGLATGVVTTDEVTGATPAAFLAYNYSRDQSANIASQIPGAAPEVLFGGGLGKMPTAVRTRLTDAGYTYVTNAAELATLSPETTKCFGLFSSGVMTPWVDRAEARRKGSGAGLQEPGLVEMTEAALRILSQHPKGFFLMVESASIDKESHSKDSTRAIWETIEFDQAIGAVKRFIGNRDDILLVVAADHETGGLTVNGLTGTGTTAKLTLGWGTTPVLPGEAMLEPPFLPSATGSADHTAVDLVISAKGPGSGQFGRSMEATDSNLAMLRALGGGYPAPAGAPASPGGDINHDGKIDLKDVTLLLRAAIGLTSL